jgi:hypothetical protein
MALVVSLVTNPFRHLCSQLTHALWAGGAHFMDDWVYYAWETDFPELRGAHINVLELFTAYLALKRWAPFLRGKHVVIRSDNMSTVAALNNTTSRSPELMRVIREIFWLSVEADVVISGVYLPGYLNVLADKISRLHDMRSARDACSMLLPLGSSVVGCKYHMTYESFLLLQNRWTVDSWSCWQKPLPLSVSLSLRRPNQHIGLI